MRKILQINEKVIHHINILYEFMLIHCLMVLANENQQYTDHLSHEKV
jgi:hypothetical protein